MGGALLKKIQPALKNLSPELQLNNLMPSPSPQKHEVLSITEVGGEEGEYPRTEDEEEKLPVT